jgi:Type IV secretion-system coupling protein DNA-binding domain
MSSQSRLPHSSSPGVVGLAAVLSPALPFSWLLDDRGNSCGHLELEAYFAEGDRPHDPGPWPIFEAQGQVSLRKAIAVTGAPQPDSLWLAPYVQLTPVAEASNILVVGDQGSGKSAVIRGWAEQVLVRGERSIIHDAKGDVLSCAPIDKFLLVAPHDARGWTCDIGRVQCARRS